MNHNKIQNSCPSHYMVEEDEINLLELILVLAKYKKMILGSCLVTFALALGFSLALPNIYSATARILPPQKANVAMSEDRIMSNSSVYVSILKSRSLADAIIDKFDLMEEYQQASRSLVYEQLEKQVSISEGKKDHIISITVEDKDPKRAAKMANAYVGVLNKHSNKNHLRGAAALRQFLEGRLEVVKEDLVQAEQKLKVFQEKNKTIRIDDQTKATIEAIARLKGELASKEIELRGSEGFEQLKIEVNALQPTAIGEEIFDDVTLATSGAGLGLKYAGLLRDFRMQVTLLELLTRQYEIARIEEFKTPPSIQMLGAAIAPAKKVKPQRSLIVLLSTFVAGFLGVLAAFLREYGQHMCDEDRQRWQAIKDSLRLRRSTRINQS